mmetsp:Transcript_135/g.161  ORF Transcript_135/g.161 Transcript_135/m.161 type:complete len:553 (+) Transcript_135:116-1774(+)|eukprot:CAMPEP_0119037040 /NCGR_PEP_ID=MMETSP1177-20130426/5135_1 /TAXON_ID=2985 /ORGANISM="Ochromonas sp, Strain CCMP1899" /LENGTH=552 /DNA_ID=CAMNT_0006997733 /DNA_START=116 /DNA_END=1774 /DNA_ORIENTATION=-
MRKYRLVAKKGEGTFSEVLKAQNVKDGKYHAIKCMKNRFDSIDQVNNLREIQALRRLSPHEHVITLEEVLYDQPTGRLALVFELMDGNLYELIRGRKHYLNPQLVKSYMWQLMKSLDHMHKKGIFHRDIKPENILIESSTDVGRGLKLADFGSCRGIYSKQPYTEYISTRWYRAPECLLTDGYYGPEMDLWGAGCVMFEITSLYPLFPGSNEVDQVTRIHKVLGAPTPEIIAKFRSKGTSHISLDFPPQKGVGIPQLIPHASPDCIDLIVKLLKYDATERITAREAMRHPYFRDLKETDKRGVASITDKATAKTESSDIRSVESDVEKGSLGGGPAPKGVSQTNKVAASGQPQAPVVKALPVIPKKGVGTGVESIQKHTQQQQNFLMKASIASTGSKMPPTDVQQASTLPPIGSNVIPVGKVGTGPQYGSTVGASTSNKQQKPLWQQRRKKSKAKFTGTGPQASQGSGSTGTTAAQGGGAIAQYLQDRLNGTGGGFIYQQGQQRSQAANPYGVGKKTIVAGIGGSSKNLVAGAGVSAAGGGNIVKNLKKNQI